MTVRILEAVRSSVVVHTPVERAFAVFTDEIGRWWPPAYTFDGARLATVEIDPHAGRWFERSRDGVETDWGEVRAFEPPRRLVLSFAVSAQRTPELPGRASEVEVRFISEGLGTRVDLEHRDFGKHGAGAERLSEGMASPDGWSLILAAFARAASR